MGEEICDQRDWVGVTVIDSKGRLFDLVDVSKSSGIANILRMALAPYRARTVRVDTKYRYVQTMTLVEIKKYVIDRIMATPDEVLEDPFETSPKHIAELNAPESLAEFMGCFYMGDLSSGPIDYILTRIGL